MVLAMELLLGQCMYKLTRLKIFHLAEHYDKRGTYLWLVS